MVGPPPGNRPRRGRAGGLTAVSCPKIWGYGGGWAGFSDSRKGLPFMPQRGGLRSWGLEERCDCKTETAEQETGRGQGSGAKHRRRAVETVGIADPAAVSGVERWRNEPPP